MSSDRLAEIIWNLMTAHSDSKMAIIQANEDLLLAPDTDLEPFFKREADINQLYSENLENLSEHRLLLENCRQVGVQQACDEFNNRQTRKKKLQFERWFENEPDWFELYRLIDGVTKMLANDDFQTKLKVHSKKSRPLRRFRKSIEKEGHHSALISFINSQISKSLDEYDKLERLGTTTQWQKKELILQNTIYFGPLCTQARLFFARIRNVYVNLIQELVKIGILQPVTLIPCTHLLKETKEEITSSDASLEELNQLAGAHALWGDIITILAEIEPLATLEKSIEHYDKAAEIFSDLGNEHGESICLLNSGIALGTQYDHGNALTYSKALEKFDKAKEICERLNDQDNLARVLLARCSLNGVKGERENIEALQTALSDVSQAIEIFSNIKNLNALAHSLGQRGDIFRTLGQAGNIQCYYSALDDLSRAAQIFETLGDKIGLTSTYANRGAVEAGLFENGDEQFGEQAISNLKMAISYYSEVGKLNELGLAHLSLGSLYVRYGEKGKAEALSNALIHYHDAEEIFLRTGNKRSLASVLLSRIRVFGLLFEFGEAGAFEKAIDDTKNAEQIFREINDKRGLAGVLVNRGALYITAIESKRLNDTVQDGLKAYTEAIHVAEEISQHHMIAVAYMGRGNIYRAWFSVNQSNGFEEAKADLIKAKKIFESIEDLPSQSRILAALGHLYLAKCAIGNLEDYHEPLEHLDDSISLHTRLNNQHTFATAQYLKCFIFAQQLKYKEALECLDIAIAATNFEEQPIKEFEFGHTKVLLLLKNSKFDDALILSKVLLSKLPQLLQLKSVNSEINSLLAHGQKIGPLMAYAASRNNNLDEGLSLLEQGRAIRLRERLMEQEAKLSNMQRSALDETRIQLDRARRRLEFEISNPGEQHSERIDSARDQLDKLHTVFNKLKNELGISDDIERLHINQITELIPSDGAVIVPYASELGGGFFILYGEAKLDHVALPSLTNEQIQKLIWQSDQNGWLNRYEHFENVCTDLQKIKDLPQASLEYQQIVTEAASGIRDWNNAIKETGELLWNCLMGPVHEALLEAGFHPGKDDAPEICVVPFGQLTALPLGAAFDPKMQKWLIEDWCLSFAPSLQGFMTSRRKSAYRGNGLLALTDSRKDLGLATSGYNPATTFFAQEETTHLVGDNATLEAVDEAIKTKSPAFLSVLCHGHWNYEDPEQSSILLAKRKDIEEGDVFDELTVADMRHLDLAGLRLAVLGACESGIPDIFNLPNEYTALPAAILEAGGPETGVIATYWPVFASAVLTTTEHLIKDFLDQEKQTGKASTARALWRTQLKMLRGDIQFKEQLETPQPEERKRTVDRDVYPFSTIMRPEGGQFPADETIFSSLNHPVHWAAFFCMGN